jgi:hypothetical protein
MRKIELTIKNCSECPYLEYDSDYGMSYDSGYDCKLTGYRIIDDWEWNNTNNKNRLNLKYDGIPIPSWCELEKIGLIEERKKKIKKLKEKYYEKN